MPISDIRRSAMVAGQKLMKFLALAALPAPGSKSARSAPQKFDNGRGRPSRRVRPDAQDLRRCSGGIAIEHDTRSNKLLSPQCCCLPVVKPPDY